LTYFCYNIACFSMVFHLSNKIFFIIFHSLIPAGKIFLFLLFLILFW
jgi:hypothetical protein